MNPTPRILVCFQLLLSLLIPLHTTSASAAAPSSPTRELNVILLLADDLGWTGLSCYGSDLYETPNLDQLAKESMRFTDAYSACTVCSPTRASLMTGMYPAKLRLTDFIAGQNRPYAKLNIPDWIKGISPHYTTIAEAFKKENYRTIHIGKWHLDNRKTPKDQPSGPSAHGFDEAYVKPNGTKGYFVPNQKGEDNAKDNRYLTDALTNRAVEAIDRNKDKPFFMHFAYHVPHTPIQARQDLTDYFAAKVKKEGIHRNPIYAAMVASLDQSVGRIRKTLKRHKLENNTVILFTSDNGGLTQRYGKHDDFTDNLPLRRGKGSAYEGGVRVPLIIHWPGITDPNSICATPVMTIDFYPTVMEIAGLRGSQSHNLLIDGTSLVPCLKNANHIFDRNLYWHYPHYHAGGDGPYSAIRSNNHRLIQFHEDNQYELYNLSDDIGETTNLITTNQKTATLLKSRLTGWQNTLNVQMPTPNPNWDPKRATLVGRR
ncbi:MAG TPA: DUF4976 domain-containing protein [Verrucomicrobiales bacterium]|nr:DUF4976 domain-containing protein [Verrucomicrobiales bacterium]